MKRFVFAVFATALPVAAIAEEIGAVSTVHNWVSPDHKIVIEAFDDPKVPVSAVSTHETERLN